jgi:hypothetical protein
MEKSDEENNDELSNYDLQRNSKPAEDKMTNFLICK